MTNPSKKVSEVCLWCGKVYEEHDNSRPKGSPTPKVPCLMLKTGFVLRHNPEPSEGSIACWCPRACPVHDRTAENKPQESWEIEFERLWDRQLRSPDGIFPDAGDLRTGVEVMQIFIEFISNLLATAREELEKKRKE